MPEFTHRKKWPRREESQEAIIGLEALDFPESGTSHGPGNARLADVMEAGTSLIVRLLMYFYMISLRSP